MRNFLANLLLSVVSVLVCVGLAEVVVRLIDGQSPVRLVLPEYAGNVGVDTTAGHIDKMPRAAGVEREWFFSDPPPLPNRTKAPQEWVDLENQIPLQPTFGAGEPFIPRDIFKVWNSAFVGDPCQHSYIKNAPGKLYVYDPPDGQGRPTFRFMPSTTLPDGLVTNAFGFRGRPVPFQRSPKTVRIVFVGASTVAEIHEFPFSGPEYMENWLNHWAAARKLDVRFEVLNAGRESVHSMDIAAIVRNEVAPLRPDLVVYYEGGNQLNLNTVVKEVPKGEPLPAGWLARWLRQAATYSALARRAEGLMVGSEWPKPDYEITWPKGLDEMDPDITRPDLPVNLSTIIRNLDSIRADLAKVNGELSVASFHWLVKDGMVLNSVGHKPILETLNIRYFPYRYRDLARLTDFENRVFAKYNATHGLPFIDVARYMPYDPDLFSDAIHNTPAGIRLRAWIEMQQLVPVIEKRLASGTWPQAVPAMGEPPPIFSTPPRLITFNCKAK